MLPRRSYHSSLRSYTFPNSLRKTCQGWSHAQCWQLRPSLTPSQANHHIQRHFIALSLPTCEHHSLDIHLLLLDLLKSFVTHFHHANRTPWITQNCLEKRLRLTTYDGSLFHGRESQLTGAEYMGFLIEGVRWAIIIILFSSFCTPLFFTSSTVFPHLQEPR